MTPARVTRACPASPVGRRLKRGKPVLKTKICELFGIELPIVSAGMGGVALSELAAAVSNAGGLGTIALAGLPPALIRAEIETARRLTRKPVAVNLLVPFLAAAVIETVVAEKPDAVTFFWGDPKEHVPRVKDAGIKVIWQCGSAEEAAAAKAAGADAVIAQGFEAGGHVRGIVTSLALVPLVRDAIGDLPMLAAGGFADGRGLVAALALGADGAVFGTRFLASNECAALPEYKQRILKARAEETFYTTLFDIGWPDAPHRVLRTALVEEWERAGRPQSGKRPGEGVATGRLAASAEQLVRYSARSPSRGFEGDAGGLAWYAGQSCSLVKEILPAGEIVKRIAAEAREIIAKRLGAVAR